MKHHTLLLLTTLLAVTPSPSDDGLRVRYLDPSGRMSLNVNHDITVRREHPIKASRSFTFDLALAADQLADAVTVTIDQAKGSYTAHEMKQRLSTRHLTGKSFPLSIGNDGRKLEASAASAAPEINLGPMVAPGFSIVEALCDSLPLLPEATVSVGTTWTTERQLRSLEGWTWSVGQLTSRHRVTAVDRKDGHTVLRVTTEASARLGPADQDKPSSGDLTRTLDWSFDATEGRLLSMSMEQETEGVTTVPQGEIRIRQLTKVELTARS